MRNFFLYCPVCSSLDFLFLCCPCCKLKFSDVFRFVSDYIDLTQVSASSSSPSKSGRSQCEPTGCPRPAALSQWPTSTPFSNSIQFKINTNFIVKWSNQCECCFQARAWIDNWIWMIHEWFKRYVDTFKDARSSLSGFIHVSLCYTNIVVTQLNGIAFSFQSLLHDFA